VEQRYYHWGIKKHMQMRGAIITALAIDSIFQTVPFLF